MRATSRFGSARRRRDETRRALLRGEAVDLEARMRRTSARGWGPWTDVELRLGPVPDGAVDWHGDDPIALGLPVTRGPVDDRFHDLDEVWLRPVRFRTEAFWGMDGDIIVLADERTTTELAVPGPVTGPLFDRLRDQLGLDRPA